MFHMRHETFPLAGKSFCYFCLIFMGCFSIVIYGFLYAEAEFGGTLNSRFPDSILINIWTQKRADIDHVQCVLTGKLRNSKQQIPGQHTDQYLDVKEGRY